MDANGVFGNDPGIWKLTLANGTEMQTAPKDCFPNGSAVTEFLLLGLPIPRVVKPFFFSLFLTIYIAIIAGNFLIIATVSSSQRLHTPMYFFLALLSLFELCFTTAIFPTILGSLLMGKIVISYRGCITQFYFVAFMACNECFLLTLMSYDRYVAICDPLHYMTVMDWSIFIKLVAGAWMTSFCYSFAAGFLMSKLHFSGQNEIDHFFCDFRPLLNIACFDISLAEFEVFSTALLVTSVPVMLIIASYARIIATILRIPSATGRQKAFSTCTSHLTVVITYFGTLILIYVVPKNTNSPNLSKALSLVYTVATPLLNPVIYTLRNNDIRKALKKCFKQHFVRNMMASVRGWRRAAEMSSAEGATTFSAWMPVMKKKCAQARTAFVISYFTGDAASWATPLIRKDDALLYSWDTFLEEFGRIFNRRAASLLKDKELITLRQGNKDLVTYVTTFN
ncbi:olfactory receptor 10A7-like [Ambystoma mexicanum]|uniref:olfactory receptor 10A7-like n=1 Tax=Ambystoma mexicanum TaxID=8296 RepID=UPI0037E92BB6